jgi:fibronectin type 3 domain-containing protein
LQFSYTWNSPASLPVGTYSVDVGVFNSDWSKNYYWNGSAGSITITSGQPPATPKGFKATARVGQINLSWTASSGAKSYSVYRGTSPGGEGTTPLALNITGASYLDASVTAGTKYFYKVAAVNTGGTSALSTEASATPKPAAPMGLTATKGNAAVILQWTATTGATSYNVYRGTSAGAERTTPVATGITTPSFTNTGLLNGTTYYFKVAAVDGGGTGPQSSEANATPGN